MYTTTHTSRKIYRSRTDKVFSGVCGALAEHFGLSSNLLRAGFIIGTLLTSFAIAIVYINCIFVMPLDGRSEYQTESRSRSKPPPIPKFKNRDEAMIYLDHQFDMIENKVRRMEDHVTSKEYVLKRKFEEL